jgi:hypothetical protein
MIFWASKRKICHPSDSLRLDQPMRWYPLDMSGILGTENLPQNIFGRRIHGVRVVRVLERIELLPTPLERLPRLLNRLSAYFGPSWNLLKKGDSKNSLVSSGRTSSLSLPFGLRDPSSTWSGWSGFEATAAFAAVLPYSISISDILFPRRSCFAALSGAYSSLSHLVRKNQSRPERIPVRNDET